METFVDACKADPFYETIKANSQNPEKKGLGYTEDKETGLSTKRNCVTQEFVHCVTGYDINDHFVKPWTHGKGNSVALLMNPIPKRAEVMLSHAWGEDIEEVMQILGSLIVQAKICGKEKEFNKETVVWFCLFSNYQPNTKDAPHDGAGPTVAEQVALKPFEQVVAECQSMLCMQASGVDIYDRKWCVLELGIAFARGKPVYFLPAPKYRQLFSDPAGNLKRELPKAKSQEAVCGPADMITCDQSIEEALGGNWPMIMDPRINEFRRRGILSIAAGKLDAYTQRIA